MRALFVAVGWALLASTSQAQSMYVFDPAFAVTEVSPPPGPPCGYPNGPIVFAFPAGPPPCPSPAPFPFAAPLGDVAVNPTTDTVYVTNGALIFSYSAAGVPLGWAIPPMPGITGMGVMAPGMLWLTDGGIYGAVPLAGIGCPGGPPLAFAIGPFPVPPFFVAPIADLDWEGATGSLIACDGAGIIGSFIPGPVPVVGPYGVFPLPPGPPCPLAPGLLGICFDKTAPGTGTFIVTDGALITRRLPGGVVAPPVWHFALPCMPIPAALPVAGLAFAGRQVTYGAGASTVPGPVPVIGSMGQSYVGNPAYTVTLAGAIPGARAMLRMGRGPACPVGSLLGLPDYLGTARPVFSSALFPAGGSTFLITRTVVGAGGGAAYVTAIPPATPPGLTFYLQWTTVTPFAIEVTSGAALTTMVP